MFEALRYEIEKALPELKKEIYPTNAPETAKKPYLVCARLRSDRIKVLDGYTNNQALTFMFSVMASRYEEMATLTGKVEKLLLSMVGNRIGENNELLVKDLSINNIEEVYEHGLKVNRGIIDFTIYF